MSDLVWWQWSMVLLGWLLLGAVLLRINFYLGDDSELTAGEALFIVCLPPLTLLVLIVRLGLPAVNYKREQPKDHEAND